MPPQTSRPTPCASTRPHLTTGLLYSMSMNAATIVHVWLPPSDLQRIIATSSASRLQHRGAAVLRCSSAASPFGIGQVNAGGSHADLKQEFRGPGEGTSQGGLTHQGQMPRFMSETPVSYVVPPNDSHWPALQYLTRRLSQ